MSPKDIAFPWYTEIAEEQHAPASIPMVELHFFDAERFWKRQTVYDDRE